MEKEKRRRVFLGVGHGGKDPGAVGMVREADANLQMALGMQAELERHGVTVGISRTADEDDPLTKEIKEANAFAPDVAVELHNNAGGNNNGADGFEVYCQTNGYQAQSRRLAACIEARAVASGQQSRGVKTKRNAGGSDYFGWLRRVRAPAVLCEGFFVDSADSRDYDTAAEQQEYGRVCAWGVLDYLGIALQPQDSRRYTVQVGAFREEPNAQRLAEKLRASGYFVQLHRTGQGAEKQVRVCVGRFDTRAKAKQTAQELNRKGFEGWVKVCG